MPSDEEKEDNANLQPKNLMQVGDFLEQGFKILWVESGNWNCIPNQNWSQNYQHCFEK